MYIRRCIWTCVYVCMCTDVPRYKNTPYHPVCTQGDRQRYSRPRPCRGRRLVVFPGCKARRGCGGGALLPRHGGAPWVAPRLSTPQRAGRWGCTTGGATRPAPPKRQSSARETCKSGARAAPGSVGSSGAVSCCFAHRVRWGRALKAPLCGAAVVGVPPRPLRACLAPAPLRLWSTAVSSVAVAGRRRVRQTRSPGGRFAAGLRPLSRRPPLHGGVRCAPRRWRGRAPRSGVRVERAPRRDSA